jgi:hypothetical protein
MPLTARPALRFWQRCLAALGVALVLALGLFGANADWHAELHDCGQHAAPHGDGETDGCAVEMFAAGVEVPVDAPSVAGAALAAREDYRLVKSALVAAPGHRLRPSRGPPLG